MSMIAKMLCLLVVPLFLGCAQRSLTITSEPAGAVVSLNGEEIGSTPVKYDFEFYGDYDVTLRKEGFETLKTNRKLKAPLSELPPFDLLREMFGAKDRREWHFELARAQAGPLDAQALISRAEDLKGELRSSRFTHPPATLPTTTQPTQP